MLETGVKFFAGKSSSIKLHPHPITNKQASLQEILKYLQPLSKKLDTYLEFSAVVLNLGSQRTLSQEWPETIGLTVYKSSKLTVMK